MPTKSHCLLLCISFLCLISINAETAEEFENVTDDNTTSIADPNREKLISDAKVKLEISKLTQTALTHIRAKEWKSAESVTKQIFELSEVSVDYFYLKGNLHYCYGEYQTAIGHLNSALKINSSHDPSYFLMGMIYAKRNEWDKSIFHFEKANQYGSYNPYYRMNLAIAYYQVDQPEKAIMEARRTLELKENYTFAKILLIKSFMKVNRKDAWFYAQEMIEKKPDSPKIFALYLQLLFEYKNNYSEVIREIGKKSNLNIQEKRYLAYSYFREHELNKSAYLFKQVINSERDTEDDQNTYLKILVLLNKDSDAERFLNSLIKNNPTKKKDYNEMYQNLLDKRDMAKGLYQPIIVR